MSGGCQLEERSDGRKEEVHEVSDAGERSDSKAGVQPLDDEMLAAFVDGTLEGEERERMLEAIDRDPDTYRVFLETSAFVEELSSEVERDDARGRVVSGERKAARRRRWGTALTLAASVLLLVVTVPIGSQPPDAGTLASRLELGERTGVAELLVAAPRLGFQTTLTPTERSLRLGALVVDLEVARRVGDGVAVRRAGTGLRELTADLDLDEADLGLLLAAERGESPTSDALESLESKLRVRSDHRAFDAGRVLEAVRLAEALGDEDYARARAIRRALRRAEGAGFGADDLRP